MMRSIVVALDGSASSANARTLALEVAGRTGAALVGIGVLDVPWMNAPRATPVGAGHYQAHRNETLLAEGRETLRNRVDTFRAECEAASIPCAAIGVEGDPVEQIDAEADRHDLIVIGRETNFHGGENHDVGATVEKLLHDNPRPLMVAPEGKPTTANPDVVVVAFDGSVTSSRAMHMFLLLGLAKGREIHVVSVHKDKEVAINQAERGAVLFRNHGYKAQADGVATSGDPADAILGAVSATDAGRLVMGAFGHDGRLRRALMGSTTTKLLREAPVPVFVHH